MGKTTLRLTKALKRKCFQKICLKIDQYISDQYIKGFQRADVKKMLQTPKKSSNYIGVKLVVKKSILLPKKKRVFLVTKPCICNTLDFL